MMNINKSKSDMTKTTLTETQPYKKRWAALAILCAAQFMVIMDTSIIGVALPAIQTDLSYTASGLSWIFNAYVIVFGGFLLLGGKLSDVYGPKKIFMTGFVLLTAASLYTGFAWSELSMNTGRALQGLGAALIAPSALTLLMSMFTDPKELGKAFGFWGASAAAGGSAGVFLGGVLTEYISWRWTFFINVPIGAGVIIAGASLLLDGRKQRTAIDYLGAFLVTAATILLVYTLVMVDKNGWTSATTLGLAATSLLLLYLFILYQKKVSSPLLPLQIFQVPNLSAGNVVLALLAGSWIPLWFYLNLYLQQILEYPAFWSGLALLPMTFAIMILMVGVSGKLIEKFGFKTNLLLGLFALTLSLFWFSMAPVNGNFLLHILGPSLLGAIGMSLAYIPGTMAAVSGAKPHEAGLASGIASTTYQVGSAIGLAVVAAIAVAITKNTAGVPLKESLNTGFQYAFRIAGFISAAGLILAWSQIRVLKQNN